jgi:two-component sensor histidine kinase
MYNFLENVIGNNVAYIVKNKKLSILHKSRNLDNFNLAYSFLENEVNTCISEGKNGTVKSEFYNFAIYEIPKNTEVFFTLIYAPYNANNKTYPSFATKGYHDIKEPLRNISNFLQLLNINIQQSNNNENKAYVSYAMDSIKKLRELAEESLIHSSSRTNKTEILIEKIINEIKVLLYYQINLKLCTIIVDEKIPPILAVKSEIFSLFKNLIENSLNHAIVDRDLIIKVSQDNKKTNDHVLGIIFEDNGKRIARDCSESGNGITICSDIAKANNFHFENIGKSDRCYKYEILFPR